MSAEPDVFEVHETREALTAGRPVAQVAAQHGGHRQRAAPRAPRRRPCRARLVMGSSISSASSQVANTLGPTSAAEPAQRGAHHRQRHVQQPPPAAGRPQGHAHELARRRASRGRRARSAGRSVPSPDEGGDHAVGHVLGPDRLVERPGRSRTPGWPAGRRSARAGSARDRPASRRSTARTPPCPAPRPPPPRAASALARKKRVREWCSAPRAEKKMKRRAPARSAARTSRSVATAFSSSIDARGWSRIDAARWITVWTPRSAFRNEGGSARSPSAIWTRTRSSPSRRGSRTRQRTGSADVVRRRRSAEPTVPLAPVSRIISGQPSPPAPRGINDVATGGSGRWDLWMASIHNAQAPRRRRHHRAALRRVP